MDRRVWKPKRPMLSALASGIFVLTILIWFGLLKAIPVEAVSGMPPRSGESHPLERIGKFSFELSAPQQITPTLTSTATATATGTILPNPTVSVSVLPTSATIGQQFTFTIVVRNEGLAPAINAAVFDSFPVFIDVVSVLTTKGTVTTIPHSVVVSLGNLDPNETVTIVITTLVNSAVPYSQTVTNVVNLTYDPSQVRTASVQYTVTLPTATATATATVTATLTGTPPTLTATASRTATASPTTTGTPPTPTFTGTIIPNPVISISVFPTSATVNQQLIFTVIVRNNGTAPAVNATLSNYLPGYLDVQNVTTTKGTISKTEHSAVVTIGTIMPNEVVTVVIPVLVNGSLSRTETGTNIVSLTYDGNQVRTASISYTAVLTTILPGTGELPLSDSTVSLAGLVFSMGLAAVAGLMSALRRGRKDLAYMLTLFLLCILGIGSACVPTSEQSLVAKDTQEAVLQESLNTPTATRTLLPFRPAYEFSTPEVIITLPSYPIPTPDLSKAQPVSEEASLDTSPVERIVIPELAVDTVVKYVPYDEGKMTWLIEGLRDEVAWLGNSSWPGLGSNTVLAGHVTVAGLGNGPFRYLENLAPGDTIILYTQEYAYTYQVRDQVIVEDTDTGVTLPTTKAQITLITCTGWDDEIDIYRYRRVVFADLRRAELLDQRSTGR